MLLHTRADRGPSAIEWAARASLWPVVTYVAPLEMFYVGRLEHDPRAFVHELTHQLPRTWVALAAVDVVGAVVSWRW